MPEDRQWRRPPLTLKAAADAEGRRWRRRPPLTPKAAADAEGRR
jgi:hypothetical protein